MTSESAIKDGLKEFIEAGKVTEDLKLYRAAAASYYKALVELCDLVLLRTIRKTPANHTQRFELLSKYKPKLYTIADMLFSPYTKTYSEQSSSETCRRIKDGIKAIAELENLKQELKESIERI